MRLLDEDAHLQSLLVPQGQGKKANSCEDEENQSDSLGSTGSTPEVKASNVPPKDVGAIIPPIRQSYQYYKYIVCIPMAYVVLLAVFCWMGVPKVALAAWVAVYKRSGTYLRTLLMLAICLPAKEAIALAFACKKYQEFEEDSPNTLQHYVVVPAYKEPVAVLARTLASLPRRSSAQQRGDINVILAMEASDDNHQATFMQLQTMFGEEFKSLDITVHVLLPNERAGKGSNENYAVRELLRRILESGADPWQCMVTVCDADSVFAPNYFDALERAYASQLDGRRLIYSAPRNTYRNFGTVWNPLIAATECVMNSADLLRDVTQPYENYSNYSLTLGFAAELDFWDPEIIPEDFHMVYRAILCSRGSSSVCRVWSMISNDTVTGFQDRFVQAKRHSWGVTTIAWIIAVCWSAPFSMDRVWVKLLSSYFSEMSENLIPSIGVPVAFGMAAAELIASSDDPVLRSSLHFAGAGLLLNLTLRWLLFFVSEAFVWTKLIPQLGSAVHWPSRCQLLWIYGTMPFAAPVSSFIFGNVACFAAIASATWSSDFQYVTAPKA